MSAPSFTRKFGRRRLTTVAKRYGISDVALRKICRQLAVPLPSLGYWAKIAAGKKLPTPPLPRYSGLTEIVRQRYVSDEPVEPDPEHLVARREFESKPEIGSWFRKRSMLRIRWSLPPSALCGGPRPGTRARFQRRSAATRSYSPPALPARSRFAAGARLGRCRSRAGAARGLADGNLGQRHFGGNSFSCWVSCPQSCPHDGLAVKTRGETALT